MRRRDQATSGSLDFARDDTREICLLMTRPVAAWRTAVSASIATSTTGSAPAAARWTSAPVTPPAISATATKARASGVVLGPWTGWNHRLGQGLHVGRHDDHLPDRPFAHTLAAHFFLVAQRQVQNAALAAVQRAEVKRRVRLADAFGGGLSAHPQFFDTQRAPVVGIEANLRMILRRHAERFVRQLFQREQYFPFVRQKQIDIGTRKFHHDIGIFKIGMRRFTFGNDVFHVEVGGVQYGFEEIFDERAGFGNRIFLVGQVQLLLFLLETAFVTTGIGEMRFSAHCCATATTLPVNQYSTSPDDAK